MGACSRFISGKSHVWTYNTGDEISAFLLYCRQSLFPIFLNGDEIPLPGFFSRFLRKIHIHSVSGLANDTDLLESGMKKRGYNPADCIDYDLMTLDRAPDSFPGGPVDLTFRKPTEADRNDLFILQSAYEREEVVPQGGYFDPDNCNKLLTRLLACEQMLVACMGDLIVGKINTNATSYTRYQIGGVYVRPEFRGLGIAVKMSAFFLKQLMAEGRGITLFVKKRNAAARSVYKKLGFTSRGDYQIIYY